MTVLPKRRVDDLAVLGGTPLFAEPLHVGRPNVGDRGRFLARMEQLLDRRWLSNRGPFVQEFEERVASLLGVRHCIAACNGTVALEIASRALGMSGEVILPAFTFVATAHALEWQRTVPAFCDVDPETGLLDPDCVARAITPRTTGIVGVHVYGRACDTEALAALARRHGLKLMYDAAHAFGCSHLGRKLGGFGDAEVFSFHATKILNTFEGGAITTNDDELAERIRLMKNFGFRGYDTVVHIGINGKMNEVCAAMGLTLLDELPQLIDANRRNYDVCRERLAGIPGLSLLPYAEGEQYNYHYLVLAVHETAALTRDALVRLLHAENVLARRYFYPGCHRMEPYRSMPGRAYSLPHTDALCERVLVLPTGTAVSEADMTAVCELLRLALENADRVRNLLLSP